MNIILNRIAGSIVIILLFTFLFPPTSFLIPDVYSGAVINKLAETDGGDFQLVGFFDLRNRETFIQVTNIDVDEALATVLVQIFDVSNECFEDKFFDNYTPIDTHVYNMRDITRNDGNPSGVELPDNAYGIVVITLDDDTSKDLIGVVRMVDNHGYEYRTNMQGIGSSQTNGNDDELIMNFSSRDGNTLSDIFGIVLKDIGNTDPTGVSVTDVVNIWHEFNVDLFDLNENQFSCRINRNVAFSCVNENHPMLGSLLADTSDAEVASFEYGINNSFPSSKAAPLLCPNNTISSGIISLTLEDTGDSAEETTIMFFGINNGDGRGSMDSFWK